MQWMLYNWMIQLPRTIPEHLRNILNLTVQVCNFYCNQSSLKIRKVCNSWKADKTLIYFSMQIIKFLQVWRLKGYLQTKPVQKNRNKPGELARCPPKFECKEKSRNCKEPFSKHTEKQCSAKPSLANN